MKKSILSLAIGIFIGLMAGSTTGAFAAVGDKLEVVVIKFTFLVDGKKKTIEAEPLSLNGSTYLPLRAVANMLGKDVVYREKERVIELNTPKEETAKMIESSTDVQETVYEGLKAITVDGQTYFDMKDYNDKFEPVKWGYNSATNEIFLAKTVAGSTEILEVIAKVSKAESGAYYVYKGRSHINIKYYQVVK